MIDWTTWEAAELEFPGCSAEFDAFVSSDEDGRWSDVPRLLHRTQELNVLLVAVAPDCVHLYDGSERLSGPCLCLFYDPRAGGWRRGG